jgi:acyl-coenzyme A thioesterase PaaI-like protein
MMDVDERHHNPMGTLRGGICCDLADAAMGYAYAANGERPMSQSQRSRLERLEAAQGEGSALARASGSVRCRVLLSEGGTNRCRTVRTVSWRGL